MNCAGATFHGSVTISVFRVLYKGIERYCQSVTQNSIYEIYLGNEPNFAKFKDEIGGRLSDSITPDDILN
jgi:hypothetical protein